jgi:hypothetical protein
MAIPVKSLMTEVDKLPGQEVAFTIGDPRWVMQSLADLYSNKELAVTREYSTNARDAMIEAGKGDQPILVTLPSMYDRYFTVQDFGIGMSEEDLTNVYTRFGDSTKRESNEFNGMLGFGSKSAIAYTNQFTVEAVKGNVKTIAVITRKPDYSIVLKIVSKTSTDEGNGVKITIPVHNHEEFRRKALDFYRFWKPGTVLVDGQEPKQAVGDKIDDNLYFSPNPGTSYVVMGNVGYRIANPDALFRNSRMNNISFVAYVDNGAVEFTPSREDLKYTDHTKNTLHQVIRGFEEKMLAEAKKQIETATSSQEAWDLWYSWGQKIGSSVFAGMEYKGIKLVHSIPLTNAIRYKVPFGGYNSRYNTDRVGSVDVSATKNGLFVTGFYPDLQSDHKKKARQYFDHKGLQGIRYIYFIKNDLDNPWIPKENVVDWDDLKAALPKAVRQPGPARPKRPKGLFDFYAIKSGKAGKYYAKPIPDDADVFYITASDANAYDVPMALESMKADDEVVVIVLAINRIEKFKRDNFGARDFMDWARKKVETDGENLLDDRSKLALNLGHSTVTWVKRLDANKVDDPKWKLVAELMDYRQYTDKYNENLDLARSLGMRYDVKEYRAAGNDDSLVEKYPLLHKINLGWNVSDEDKAEVITYLNAAYAAKKGKP